MATSSSDSERLDEISNQVANLQENVNYIGGRLGALESTAEGQGRQLEGLQGTVSRQWERLIAVEVQLTA